MMYVRALFVLSEMLFFHYIASEDAIAKYFPAISPKIVISFFLLSRIFNNSLCFLELIDPKQ